MHKAASYAAAQRWAKRNPNRIVQWDAGEGWTSEGFWCPRRQRFICSASNGKGGFC